MQVHRVMTSSNVLTFNKDKDAQIKYQKTIEKRNYIDAKTEGIRTAMELSFITALLSAPINIKNGKWNGLSITALIASFALFIAQAMLKIKLSEEFDKE